MKLKRSAKLALAAVLCLFICFAISLIKDYAVYNPRVTSAPFYVYIIVRAIEFLIPAAILLIAALIMQLRKKKSA